MKRFPMLRLRLLVLLLSVVMLFSCKRKGCQTYCIEGITISNSSGAPIPDSMIKVIRFAKNGNFSQPIDSFSRVYSNPSYEMTVLFDTTGSSDYNFDAICILYPSGKLYKITQIAADNGKAKPGITCVNPVHFVANNYEISQQGYLGMKGFVLEVPY